MAVGGQGVAGSALAVQQVGQQGCPLLGFRLCGAECRATDRADGVIRMLWQQPSEDRNGDGGDGQVHSHKGTDSSP